MIISSDKLLPKFQAHLKDTQRLDLTTPWSTEGTHLDYLQEACARSKNPCTLRALVGISNRTTTPSSLNKLNELGELRIAYPESSRLFHAKVYLFHKQDGDLVGWIGSANFTHRGFEDVNTEIIVEVQDVSPLLDWFDKHWELFEGQDKKVIDDYCKDWTPPELGQLDERTPHARQPVCPGLQKIVFEITEVNYNRRAGVLKMFDDRGNKLRETYPLGNLRQTMTRVLQLLSQDWSDVQLLERISNHDFKFKNGKALSKNIEDVHFRPRNMGGMVPFSLDNSGWYMTYDVTHDERVRILQTAADFAEVHIEFDSVRNAKGTEFKF